MFNKQIINSIKTDYRGKAHRAPDKEKAKKINIKPTNFFQTEAVGSKDDKTSKKGANNQVVNQWLLSSEQEERLRLLEDDNQNPKEDANSTQKSEIGVLNDTTLQAMNSEKAEEPKITDGAYPDTIKSENPGVSEEKNTRTESEQQAEQRDEGYNDNYRGGYNKTRNTKSHYHQNKGSKYGGHYENKSGRGKQGDEYYDDEYYNEETAYKPKYYDKAGKNGGSNGSHYKYYKKEDSENTGYSERKYYKKTDGQKQYGKPAYQKEVVTYVVKEAGSH